MNVQGIVHGALSLAGLTLLAGCASISSSGSDELVLYNGTPGAGLHVQLATPAGQRDLAGMSAEVSTKPGGTEQAASVRKSSKDGSDDALTMRWSNAWFTSLRFVADKPMDLRRFLPDGTVEFDVRALDLAKSGLSFAMGCGKDCGRTVAYVQPSRALQGKDWQRLSVPLQCFEREGNDFSGVTQPFVVDSAGSGEVALANLKIVSHGKPNVPCVNYRVESVTPTPLAETWSLDWWMPRHEKKLQEIRALKAAGLQPELVFIGDSITHGWEDPGRPVWDEYYKKYNALDLGFSGDRTENVLWRLQHGEIDGIAPKVAVLMIGTNNTGHRQDDPKIIAAGIKRLVDELRQRLPDTKVLALAIFPRDKQPDSPLRRINNGVNALIAGLADGRDVFFLDINRALMNADGTLSEDVMPDLLHPNEKGYRIWAQAMEPALQKLLAQ